MPVPSVPAPSGASPPRAGRPQTLTAALFALGIEVAALLLVAGFFVADVVRGLSPNLSQTHASAAFLVALAALLGLAGRAVAHGRRWGRGPVLAWQFIQGALALTQVRAAWLLVLTLLLSLVVLFGVASPAVFRPAVRADQGRPAPRSR